MKKYIIEFIGMFFLALVIGLTVASGTEFAPIAIGSTLMAMVYFGGHISRGHYNPAVAIGHNLISGALGSIWIYLVGPLAGSAVAAGIFRITNPDKFS